MCYMMYLNMDWVERNWTAGDDGSKDLADFKSEAIDARTNGLLMFEGVQSLEVINTVNAVLRCCCIKIPNFGRAADEVSAEDISKNLKPELVYSRNQLPYWDKSSKSLLLKFKRGRVKVASPKNFILSRDEDPTAPLNPDAEAILQFGKRSPGVFSLDYRNPISALQAFGIALTMFCWQGGR
jgi:hypothetical protein